MQTLVTIGPSFLILLRLIRLRMTDKVRNCIDADLYHQHWLRLSVNITACQLMDRILLRSFPFWLPVCKT